MTGKDLERELDNAADDMTDKINSISRSVRERIEGLEQQLEAANVKIEELEERVAELEEPPT